MEKQEIYLDNAASSQTPKAVLDAMQTYYTEYRSNIHRGFYDSAVRATKAYDEARLSVQNLINASSHKEVIFTSGATASINMLARMLEPNITAGDNIVLTEMEHHANLIPWQQLSKRTGCDLRFIPVTDDYVLDYNVASKLVDKKTKLVSFVHVSNTLGTINDAKKLISLANAVDAYTLIDAAQSIGHMPIDVTALDCDFLVASGHKMYGPTGIGILYGKETILESLEPVVFGGDMINRVSLESADWSELPSKFEAGTPPIAEAIGLGSACDYIQKNRTKIEHEHEITDYLITSLQNINVRIIGLTTNEQRLGAVSFQVGDAHPHDVADILAKQGIAVRAGHHCTMPLMKRLSLPGTVRASISMHTTKVDIDALIQAIGVVKQTLLI
jgi:cysteine desulfurase/selenocysteine lyase